MPDCDPEEKIGANTEATNARAQLLQDAKSHFIGANIAAIIISVISGFISNETLGHLDSLKAISESGATFITQLHWLVLFASAIFLDM